MFGNSGVAVVMAVTGMMGYDIVVVANLNIGRRIGQLHFLADVDVRDAVVVDNLVKTCIAVFIDRSDDMLLHLVTDRVQRAEGFLFYILEVIPTRVVAPGKVLVVVLLKRIADRYVK